MNNRIASAFLWRLFERVGAQGVTLIVTVILARLLDPAVYGTVTLVTVFISILEVFVSAGFGTALVQKLNADDIDFSSVFYFNVFMGTVLYVIIFFAAPLIARFYGDEQLIPLIRVLSLSLPISGVKNIQHAYVSRNLLFKKFFFSTLGGTVGAAILGIWMAYNGYGVWALVAQTLFNQTLDTAILWLTVKWQPKKMFSAKRLNKLFSFGWKMFASSLINCIYEKIRQLIIGRRYSESDLAYYDRGNGIPSVITSAINSSIDSVLLPTMSAEQEKRAHVKAMTRRAIKVSTYIIMPLMMGLAVCARPLIAVILTDKWIDCVPYLRIFCFSYAFYPIHTANLNAINALGRSDYFLKLEVIKKFVGTTAILISMWFGTIWMARSTIITSILSQVVNAYPNKKLLGYSYPEQLRDMLPQIVLSCVMGAIVYCVTLLHLSDWLTLLIQVPLGAAIYIAGSKLCRIDSFTYLWAMGKSMVRKV